MNLLIILAIVLGIIALSKVVKVLEQASFAKGENTYEPNAKENKMQALLTNNIMVLVNNNIFEVC